MQKKYQIIAVGNPLMDIEIKISENQLKELRLVKNSMTLIIEEEKKNYLERFKNHSQIYSSGGSVANTLYDISILKKEEHRKAKIDNIRLGLLGFIAKDEAGSIYQREIEKVGIDFLSEPLAYKKVVTGSSLIFITPDGNRTMRTNLGCATELKKEKIDFNLISQAEIIYLEGYLLNSPNNIKIVYEMIEWAQKNNTQIALTCSDAFCVQQAPEVFQNILAQSDFFFANYEEALTILGLERDEKIPFPILIKEIQNYPHTKKLALKAITAGTEGSCLIKNNQTIFFSAEKVPVLDTTGAGDAYAAGIFYNYLQKFPLTKIGELATSLASRVIRKYGARI